MTDLDARRLQRLESLFDRALAIPPNQRGTWLDHACEGDAELIATLREMLRFDQQVQTDLARGIGRLAEDALEPGDRSGERIGRYRLRSRIRFGGMAEVYAAVRDDGEFAHDVALKITRSDHPSSAEMARLFQHERGVLARLRHPNICQIFDGGTTAQGEAWFVMELLKGKPLIEACRHLPWDDVLRHFLDLCAAVLHTHRQLIVHRDIKPDNVLLAEGPQGRAIKLLDFGIAGSIEHGEDPTARGDHWYSANSAAPEVRAGEKGGIAADVYSLGRLLARLAAQFPRSRRSDIEQIAARASATEASQRYADVEQLAEDLRRVRDRRPISLRSHQPGYVLQRFVQRRAPVLIGVLALMIATAVFLSNEQRLRQQAEAATALAMIQRDRANRIRDFMLEAYQSADPASNAGHNPTVAELLEQQLLRLESRRDLDAGLRAGLLGTLGEALLNLGRFELADRALQQAAQLNLEDGPDHAQWALHTTLLGQSAQRSDRLDRAEAVYAAVDADREHWSRSELAPLIESRLYSSLGPLAFHRGRLDEAETLIRRGLSARAQWAQSQNIAVESSALLVTLGAVQDARGRPAEAQATFEQAYAQHRANGHEFTASHLALVGWLGIVLDKQGRAADAEPYLIEAVSVAERLYPKPHPRLSGAYGNLGVMYLMNGRLADADLYLRKGIEVTAALGDKSSTVYQSRLHNIGLLALAREDLAAARPPLEQSLALRRAQLGEQHVRTARTRLALAQLDLLEGRDDAALQGAALAAEAFGDTTRLSDIVPALLLRARGHARSGQAADALKLLQQAQSLLQAQPQRHRERADAELARGYLLQELGEVDPAAEAFTHAIGSFDSLIPTGHPARARAQVALASLCLQQGNTDCARRELDRAAPVLEANLSADGPTRRAWAQMANALR